MCALLLLSYLELFLPFLNCLMDCGLYKTSRICSFDMTFKYTIPFLFTENNKKDTINI